MAARARLRDRDMARRAYSLVAGLLAGKGGEKAENVLKDYSIALQAFTGSLLRDGLAAAVAAMERQADLENRGQAVLSHLAAGIADSTEGGSPDPRRFAEDVRRADTRRYMRMTREAIEFVTWLRRAVQANEATMKAGSARGDARAPGAGGDRGA
ncbi:MAG: hypothetical protein IRZ11_08780 [Clostridia bacterium]|nr:hypothetical protein [Clostridia bacterium]